MLDNLLKYSPAVGLWALVLSFIVTGGIQMFFYVDVFADKMDIGFAYAAGIAIAVIIQGARFAFGIQAVSESYHGKFGKMLVGLFFSIGVTILETYEFAEISEAWLREDFAGATQYMLFAVLWIGFALEVRLIMNVSNGGTFTGNDHDENTGAFPEKVPQTRQEKPRNPEPTHHKVPNGNLNGNFPIATGR